MACARCRTTPAHPPVATVPGILPVHRADQRAQVETQTTGHPHHVHYDLADDEFVVVRDS